MGFVPEINYLVSCIMHVGAHECRKKGHRKIGHGKKGTGKMGTGKKGTLQKKTDIM